MKTLLLVALIAVVLSPVVQAEYSFRKNSYSDVQPNYNDSRVNSQRYDYTAPSQRQTNYGDSRIDVQRYGSTRGATQRQPNYNDYRYDQ